MITLAEMLARDKTALICDLAETYGILDFRALPVETLAALSAGLREDSRIKMKMAGIKIPADILMMAAAVDRLSLLVWLQTKDAEHGGNRPPSVLEILMGEESTGGVMSFNSGMEFEEAREKIMRGNEDVNDTGQGICSDNPICKRD